MLKKRFHLPTLYYVFYSFFCRLIEQNDEIRGPDENYLKINLLAERGDWGGILLEQ